MTDRLQEVLAEGQPEGEEWAGELGDELGDERTGGVPAGRHRRGRVPLVSVPESLRSVEVGVGRQAVRGMLLLTVVVALVLGARWAWAVVVAVPQESDVVTTSVSDSRAEEGSGPTTATSTDAAATTAGDGGAGSAVGEAPAAGQGGGEVVVHVTGQVAQPGVVTVRAGARVMDAITAAGGFTREADQSALNLARPVVDGEQVWVGRPGEDPPVVQGSAAPAVPGGQPGAVGQPGAGAGAGGGAEAGGATGQALDLNSATQAQLEELPGVGPVTAGKILAWREQNGRFSTPEELLEVSGIGERTFAEIEPHVAVAP